MRYAVTTDYIPILDILLLIVFNVHIHNIYLLGNSYKDNIIIIVFRYIN